MAAEAGECTSTVLCDTVVSHPRPGESKLPLCAAELPGLPTLEFLRWRFTKFTFYRTISGSRALTLLIP